MADYDGIPGIPVTATGTLTEPLSTSDELPGYATVQATGTWTSLTVLCEGSNDGGSTWVALQLTNLTSGATIAGGTGITGTGLYRIDVGGVHRYRFRCSAFSSATGAKIHHTKRIG